MRPWTASQQNGHTNKNNEDWEASQAALKISQFLITAFTDKSLPTKAQGAVDTSSPTKQNRPTLFGKTTHRTSNSYTKKTSNLFTYLHNHSSSSTGATSVLQLLLLSSNSLFSHSSKHYRKKILASLCTFPRKSLLAMVVVSLIILIHASQIPMWSFPSLEILQIILILLTFLSMIPMALIPPLWILLTSLITMAMVFVFFLTKSLSLSYAKVFW